MDYDDEEERSSSSPHSLTVGTANSTPPPLKIVTKRHPSIEYIYMKTVDEADQFEQIRVQNGMTFSGETMGGKRSKFVCSKQLKEKGGCKFKMLVQTSENGEAFHVYTANSHNHPIASTKGIKAKRENQQVKTQEEEKIIKAVEVMQNANNHSAIFPRAQHETHQQQQHSIATADMKANKWRMLRTISGGKQPPNLAAISLEFHVFTNIHHQDGNGKRILLLCQHQSPTVPDGPACSELNSFGCPFRMLLIRNGTEGSFSWKLYSRFQHNHLLLSNKEAKTEVPL